MSLCSVPDADGRTPILWAASNGLEAKDILRSKRNYVYYSGNAAAFKSLVQAGANKFAVDRDRLSVLHCASSHGHTEVVSLMLELSPTNFINARAIFTQIFVCLLLTIFVY